MESEQKNLLINNQAGEHPFYLSCVCENLRQFGDYSLITQRLRSYPQNTDELFDFLLNEAYQLVDNRVLLDAVSVVKDDDQTRRHIFILVLQTFTRRSSRNSRNRYRQLT